MYPFILAIRESEKFLTRANVIIPRISRFLLKSSFAKTEKAQNRNVHPYHKMALRKDDNRYIVETLKNSEAAADDEDRKGELQQSSSFANEVKRPLTVSAKSKIKDNKSTDKMYVSPIKHGRSNHLKSPSKENVIFSYGDDITKSDDNDKHSDRLSTFTETNYSKIEKPLRKALEQNVNKLHVIIPKGNKVRVVKTTDNNEKYLSARAEATRFDVAGKELDNNVTDKVLKNSYSIELSTEKVETSPHKSGFAMLHSAPIRRHARPTPEEELPPMVKPVPGHEDHGLIQVVDTDKDQHANASPSEEQHTVTQPIRNEPAASSESSQGNLHLTGAVAMVPALIHHDQKNYDYETGHITPGATHVEPLIPVDKPLSNPQLTLAHDGCSDQEHGCSMLPQPLPELHAPLPHIGLPILPANNPLDSNMLQHPGPLCEHHDEYNVFNDEQCHEHLVPLPHLPPPPPVMVPPPPPKPPPPSPPPRRRPDVIKVEFVPEEASIEIGTNRTKTGITRSTKKAGTVRVQFIPGEANVDREIDSAAFARTKEEKDEKQKKEKSFDNTKKEEKTEMTPSAPASEGKTSDYLVPQVMS